ncbi:glutamyl-Q tRNA(Asp) synthetase [Litorivivens lipolytica]|uniref:Glutamyl-Q tRNA(Asp) synthetase n=1 Tax=Litorivivens lipolytica TaxID=1524264 RepID=A0A7W4W495_9GAMM|nr:tRNA glutamyl-Q(34) synthetase GluQRS [Litorivivens lipolytica]MBB3046604.1 glutamyl-Q tRNA(Asp) synthetase [Litorivivens lipolytica]
MPSAEHPYIGRFAPSPTGPLHIGSLIGALASFLDARANHGQWLLRMENIDPPREIAGSDERILNTLRRHGLHWDGPMLEQSTRSKAYDAALQTLLDAGLAFRCSCSRRQLAEFEGIHRGHCVAEVNPNDCAIRLAVPDELWQAHDRLQTPIQQNLARDVGDFILKRRDGYYAYQLAVVVDDAFQGITHVVRGSDLWVSTPRQRFLQQQLGFSSPSYLHFPVIIGSDGHKLSKQTFAAAVDDSRACDNLLLALRFLNQPLPTGPNTASVEAILEHAIQHWDTRYLPPFMGQPESNFY